MVFVLFSSKIVEIEFKFNEGEESFRRDIRNRYFPEAGFHREGGRSDTNVANLMSDVQLTANDGRWRNENLNCYKNIIQKNNE